MIVYTYSPVHMEEQTVRHIGICQRLYFVSVIIVIETVSITIPIAKQTHPIIVSNWFAKAPVITPPPVAKTIWRIFFIKLPLRQIQVCLHFIKAYIGSHESRLNLRSSETRRISAKAMRNPIIAVRQ